MHDGRILNVLGLIVDYGRRYNANNPGVIGTPGIVFTGRGAAQTDMVCPIYATVLSANAVSSHLLRSVGPFCQTANQELNYTGPAATR